MEFQFNTSNDITGDDDVRARVEANVRQKLDRIADSITRIELHISDENGPRGGDDKRAVMEARPRGFDPISVTHSALTVDLAAAGAADKLLKAFDRDRGKRTTRKGH
jgi:hypothetical protein